MMLVRTFLAVFGVLACFSLIATAAGIDAISVTIGLPIGNMPLLFGITIRGEFPFGDGMASLLVSPAGKTLLRIGAELPLGNSGSYLRLDGGIAYFDLAARFPKPVFGGGISYRIPAHGLQFGVTGEILYPIALGPPLLLGEGGWSR